MPQDAPSRDEVAARLEAAEARTETRITQLAAVVEAKHATTDHKIDALASKVDALAGGLAKAIQEVKDDNQHTRRAIWEVGVGAVLAVLALVAALWIAGLGIQSNLLAAFQAGVSVRSLQQPATPAGATNAPTKVP